MHELALHALHVALMKGQGTQYLWIDSTTLPVCKTQRIQHHKSLVQIASRGRSSMGWFYGCKLHIAMNQFGEIACSALSNGHVADIKMVEQLVAGVEAKLYGDRGYISQELKIRLKHQGIDLIIYHRKNMQAIQLCASDESSFDSKASTEPYRVCRRVNILRDYSDEKTKLYPRN